MSYSASASLCFSTSEGVIIVEVGPSQRKYFLHKTLVIFHSEYFRKAPQAPWTEAQKGIVKLEDVDISEFNVFVHWLYNQPLPKHDDQVAWERILETKDAAYGKRLQIYLQAYALGDRLLAPAFRRAINSVTVSVLPVRGLTAADLIPAYAFAFANIPSNRAVLQFLEDDILQ